MADLSPEIRAKLEQIFAAIDQEHDQIRESATEQNEIITQLRTEDSALRSRVAELEAQLAEAQGVDTPSSGDVPVPGVPVEDSSTSELLSRLEEINQRITSLVETPSDQSPVIVDAVNNSPIANEPVTPPSLDGVEPVPATDPVAADPSQTDVEPVPSADPMSSDSDPAVTPAPDTVTADVPADAAPASPTMDGATDTPIPGATDDVMPIDQNTYNQT